MKHFSLALALTVLLGTLAASTVWAQGATFSVQFDNTPLAQVLASFQRLDPTLQYVLPPEFADLKITASLVDLKIETALGVVASQAGLQIIKDGDIWQVRPRNQSAATRAPRPLARTQLPTFILRPAEVNTVGLPIAPTAQAGQAGQSAAKTGANGEEENPPLRLIMVKYADPADLAWLFGGDVVEGGGLYGTSSDSGSGSGYGSSGGGYGNNNSSYGSNNGSSYGSNRNSGSSSNRGSSRSNRSGSNSSY